MPKSDEKHPIRRVREAFKNASLKSGLRQYSSSVGFARLLDRAASSIRNVESGQTKKWDKLAQLVESVTGVSAKWMLEEPKPSDPIVDINGEIWDPENHMDYLGGAGDNLDWRLLMSTSPRGVIKLATKIVELKLSKDLLDENVENTEGASDFLADLAKLLAKHSCFQEQDVIDLVGQTLIDDAKQIVADLTQVVRKAKG
ncbi:MAG: hypothetical protein QM686_20835 [Herbaspirillum sp.]